LEVRRQLKQQDAELWPERGGDAAERRGELFAPLQLRIVRDAPGGLQREREPLGRTRRPAVEQRLGRHPVEGVVDFDRVEALGVVGEHLVGRELLGIERTAPLRLVVAGGADQVAHGGRWYQRPSPAARVANSTRSEARRVGKSV